MPYRFAIIGCGNVADRHADAIQHVGTLEGVCDKDASRAEALGNRWSCPWFTSIESLLNEAQPQIVAICTPSGLHPEHAITCLEAGCDVLCEKPLATDSESAMKMVDFAARLGKRLFVVKQNRYNPNVVLLKRVLDAGMMGTVHAFAINCSWNRDRSYYASSPWRGDTKEAGGLLFTQYSHFIDLLVWMLGDVKQVHGWRANYCHQETISFEDTGAATMLMENGALGSLFYTVNASGGNMEGSLALYASQGTVKIGGVYLNRIDHFAVEHELAHRWLNEMSPAPSNPHVSVYRELVNAIAGKGDQFVDAEEAMRSIKMIERIYSESPLIS
jgi:UDP-N-acetyl-2-amino-2-deoxyglucuronate dehydrogenase